MARARGLLGVVSSECQNLGVPQGLPWTPPTPQSVTV